MKTLTKKFPIGATFGIQAPAAMTVEGFEDALHPLIPAKKDYVFRNEHLRDVLAFIANPFGDAYVFGWTHRLRKNFVDLPGCSRSKLSSSSSYLSWSP